MKKAKIEFLLFKWVGLIAAPAILSVRSIYELAKHLFTHGGKLADCNCSEFLAGTGASFAAIAVLCGATWVICDTYDSLKARADKC